MLFGLFLVFASVLLCGCPKATTPGGNGNQTGQGGSSEQGGGSDSENDKTPDLPAEVETAVQINFIEVALIGKDAKAKEYKKLADFAADKAGPYSVEDAETAYLKLRVNADQPDEGDFKVSVKNNSAFVDTMYFSRDSGDKSNFVSTAGKNIVLAKGENVIDVNIETTDKKHRGLYRFTVKYLGGPDFSDPDGPEPSDLIPGIYCPAQGKNEPFLWVSVIGGRCSNCPAHLAAIGPNGYNQSWEKGKGGNFARKFKNKGFRALVFEHKTQFTDAKECVNKWNGSGRGYNMYTPEHNYFYELVREGGVPQGFLIKKGKKVEDIGGGRPLDSFTASVKKSFGLE